MTITGLDNSRPFPQESEFILELGKKPGDDFDPPSVWTMRWRVSLAKPERPIVLKRLP